MNRDRILSSNTSLMSSLRYAADNCKIDKKCIRARTAGNDPPSQVLNNRHDVIMHYVNVITNSGILKQPGRDTILIDYYYCYYYYYYCRCDSYVNPI